MKLKTIFYLLIAAAALITNVSYAAFVVQINLTNYTQYKYNVIQDSVLAPCNLVNQTSYRCAPGQELILETADADGGYNNISFAYNKDNSYRVAQTARGAINPIYKISGSIEGTLPAPDKQYIDGIVNQNMMINISVSPAKSLKKSH